MKKTIKLFIAMLLFVVPVILLIVLLGYAKQSENQGTEEPLETEESKMEALKILVVDDESRMRKLVKDFLAKKNFQVLEAGDGGESA